MNSPKDLSGQRFGQLLVIGRSGSDRYGAATWLCSCGCGNQCIVSGVQMRRGHVKSCGCLNNSQNRRLRAENYKHGMSQSRLYWVWASMKSRCHNPNTEHFNNYGGRGITVCDEWRNDFRAFYDWAIANGYDENAPFQQCTIDRIDNDKGYSPDNCRWVDQITQAGNRSNSRTRTKPGG